MATEATSAADRRKFANSERVNSVIVLDIGTAKRKQSIPFIFALMSNLHGNACSQARSQERQEVIDGNVKKTDGKTKTIFDLHEICQRSDFEDLLMELAPQFYKKVKNKLAQGGPDLDVSLDITSMRQFNATSLMERIPEVARYLKVKESVENVLERTKRSKPNRERLGTVFDDPDFRKAIAG